MGQILAIIFLCLWVFFSVDEHFQGSEFLESLGFGLLKAALVFVLGAAGISLIVVALGG